ncbi:MAG: ABC transporter substrate-binding protein [Chitinophagaceae bacterium]|nr:ABC transporter substrate-binding protein [Chitinophagaceae bacterium]MCW5928125.1 ABC transporter substrate-binding protein [Chitinophagaceae bacterium]
MKSILFFWLALFSFKTGFAQDSVEIKKVALFAPLYLDTLFDAKGNYTMDKRIPGFLKPGLEFYQGALMAIDSLDREGIIMDVDVYDTRKKGFSLFSLVDNGGLNGTGLILGAVSGKEYLDLAQIAKEKQIPFVSVSYPNDGGISNNPYVIIANSKLNTHLQAVYNYTLRNFGTSKLIMLKRQGNADNRVTDVFKSLNASKSGEVLSIQTAALNSAVNNADIETLLDKDRDNILICGSLDDNFAKRVFNAAAALSQNYKITLIGMPTWESFIDPGKTDTKNLALVYSSTLYNPGPQANEWVRNFTLEYGKATYTRPTVLAFHSYELTYIFLRMLYAYDKELLQHMDDKTYRLITDFDFRTVRWNSSTNGADYFENKRIYILKLESGKLEKLN